MGPTQTYISALILLPLPRLNTILLKWGITLKAGIAWEYGIRNIARGFINLLHVSYRDMSLDYRMWSGIIFESFSVD